MTYSKDSVETLVVVSILMTKVVFDSVRPVVALLQRGGESKVRNQNRCDSD